MISDFPPKAPIQVFDSSLNFLGEVDIYSSLTHSQGWNKPGDWSLAINWNILDDTGNLRYAALFEIGGYITVGNDGYKCGIINTIDKPINQDGKLSQTVTISGAEPGVIFNRRLLNAPVGQDTYTLSAPAETIIKTVISDQCGPTATNIKRQFPLLEIATDQGRGESYLISNAYTNVLDEISACSIATTLGWFIYLDRANKKLVLDCALGNNLVAGQPRNAIFSTNHDTLQSAELSTTIGQYKNLATVTGKGKGSSRPVIDVYNGAEPSGFDRYESYVNANDKTSTPDLTLKGQALLGTYKYTSTLEGAALAKSPLIYGTDYNLGDYVTIQSYDFSLNKQITMVDESWSNLSYEIMPTFDKVPATITSQMANSSANLGAQVSKISTEDNYTEPLWLPYPAGEYTFPSGVQNVSAGVLAIGATITAPAQATTCVNRAFYRDHGPGKTIDILLEYTHANNAGSTTGAGTYLVPLPRNFTLDTNFVTVASDPFFDGTMLGYCKLNRLAGSTYGTNYANLFPYSTALLAVQGAFFTNASTAIYILWSSAAVPFSATKLTFSTLITGVPVV